MAVYNMPKPQPVGNPAIGYNKPPEGGMKPSYSAYTKPGAQDMAKPITRPPGRPYAMQNALSAASNRPPSYTKPPMQTNPGFTRPPATIQPIGNQMQMRAAAYNNALQSNAAALGALGQPFGPPQQITPIGPSLQMQANPVGMSGSGGGGYTGAPIGGRFGPAGENGALAAALQRLFGY